MKEETTFEEHIDKAKENLEQLMNPDATLSDSVKAFEDGMSELKTAQKILEDAKLQIEKIKVSNS